MKNYPLSLALIFGALMAPLNAEARFFLGFGAGAGSAEIEYQAAAVFNNVASRYSEEDSLDFGAGLFMIGANTSSARIYLVGSSYVFEDAEIFFTGLSAEYKFSEGLFRPYVGGSLGFAEFKWTETHSSDDFEFTLRPKEDEVEGLGLGGQGGIMLEFDNGLGLDFGIRGLRFLGLTSQFETINFHNGAINLQLTAETAAVGHAAIYYTF